MSDRMFKDKWKKWTNFLSTKWIHKKKKKTETYTFKEVFVIMIISILVGGIACFSFMKIFYEGKNYSILNGDLSKLVSVYNTIMSKYYQKIDKEELIDEAIDSMLSAVDDPYTTYIDASSANSFLKKVDGTYEGIGCQVATTLDSKIIVLDVFENSPSDAAGLKQGDIILEIDDKSFEGKNSTDMANYIQKEAKSSITMKIKREEEVLTLELKREKVEIPSIYTQIYEKNDKKIGYLQITIFSSVTDKQFFEKLSALEEEKIDSLIIDVRDNSGGYLDVVTNILDKLLEKNSILYKLETTDNTKIIKSTKKECRTYPIAVLTNHVSASASEILASAIKESYGGYIVGENTYGKATVQQTKSLSDGSMIKYTTQKWLTPNGNWINEVGLAPTHEVKQSEEYYLNPIPENDLQLQEALKILSE